MIFEKTKISSRPGIGIVVLAVFHFFGIVGLFTPFRDWFIGLTWLNLLISFVILLLYNLADRERLAVFLVVCYLLGFFAEFLGVNYGLIFGNYAYGEVLGWQLFGVPVVIGINWFVVSYCCVHLAAMINSKWYFTIIGGSIFTVLLDFLIEPVAIQLGYWTWEGGDIPISNYLGWFLVSLLILGVFRILRIKTNNPLALPLLIIQVVFFVLVQLLSQHL